MGASQTGAAHTIAARADASPTTLHGPTAKHEGHEGHKGLLEGHPLDSAVLQDVHVEVDDEPETKIRRSQIRDDLPLMNVFHPRSHLHLDDDASPDEQIDPVPRNLPLLVPHADSLFALVGKTNRIEFEAERSVVNPFLEPRPEDSMNGNPTTNDPPADFFRLFRDRLRASVIQRKLLSDLRDLSDLRV